jgi:hypothetical protein
LGWVERVEPALVKEFPPTSVPALVKELRLVLAPLSAEARARALALVTPLALAWPLVA